MVLSGNRLLRRLSADAIAALQPMRQVPLPMRHRLDPSNSVYFIDSGVVSVIAGADGRLSVELGIIGNEGMVGLEVVYGDDQSPYRNIVQVEGVGMQVDRERLRRLLERDAEARAALLQFARAFSIQVAGTALANGRSKLDERLARWLLMVSDRAGPSFAITHEFISVMLGVRRSGVTLAIQVLEGHHLIRAARGSMTILDRDGLVVAAGGAYGFSEVHYQRLLGGKG